MVCSTEGEREGRPRALRVRMEVESLQRRKWPDIYEWSVAVGPARAGDEGEGVRGVLIHPRGGGGGRGRSWFVWSIV